MKSLAKNSKPINKKYIVRDTRIPSRFFLAPINTGFAQNGRLTARLLQFHAERSGQGIGISYVGNVAIGPEFTTNDRTLYLQGNLTDWRYLISTVQENGSLIGVQLACRMSKSAPRREWTNPKVAEYINYIRHELNEIPKNEIDGVIESFIQNARALIDLGVEVIQIHAAHGYLLSTLLSEVLNSRQDVFGHDRLLPIRKIVEGIRQVSSRVILDLRLSFYEGLVEKEAEAAYKAELLGQIVHLDLDIISISNGIYDVDKRLIYPTADMGHGVFVDVAAEFANRYPNKLWNIAGNIWDLRRIDPSVPHNLTFSIGRALIADPSLVCKSLNGQYSRINTCARCDLCHYYINKKPRLTCVANLAL